MNPPKKNKQTNNIKRNTHSNVSRFPHSKTVRQSYINSLSIRKESFPKKLLLYEVFYIGKTLNESYVFCMHLSQKLDSHFLVVQLLILCSNFI